MFWKFATTSNIDTLLEKEDITLQDLMDDDDILQECKGQNAKLIDFLCRLDVMEELVGLIITDPPDETNDGIKYKYPNIACELLTCDVPQMNDILGETESLREKLFSFLECEEILNPLLASFFSKVMGILLSRKPEPTLEFIKSRDDFLGSVLKHLETSAIMDLLLRLVTCVEAVDLRAQILSWLNGNNLVERLIGLIDPSADDEFHCNSAQSLCDIIRLSREHMYTMQESAQEDPLLATLERKETVQLLLKHMFDYGINESVIINGISVLLALLEIRRPAPFGFPEMAPELTQLDVERLACGVSKTLHGLSDRLSDFYHLLENPPSKKIMHCTFGELNPPLGNTRLHVGKLLSAILITNTHNINVQLSELHVFNALLDLFFRYEYNNFLHTQVVHCVQTVLGNAVTVGFSPCCSTKSSTEKEMEKDDDDDTDNPRKVAPLLTHLFEDCRIIQRILDAWDDSKCCEAEGATHRKGNMGHLTLITNHIVENMDKGANSERIHQFIEGMPEEDQDRWRKFVTEPLAEVNERNSRELGGHNPMHFSSDDDGEDIAFNPNSAQQAFTNYQIQQITSDFIDQFGFADGDIIDQEETDKFDKINSVDFNVHTEIDSSNQDLFEDVCKATLPSFGESSDEDDDKDFFESGIRFDDNHQQLNEPAGCDLNFVSSFPTSAERFSGEQNFTNDDKVQNTEFHHVATSGTSISISETSQSQGEWISTSKENDCVVDSSDHVYQKGSPTQVLQEDKSAWITSGEKSIISEHTEGWANFDNMDCTPRNDSTLPTSSLDVSGEEYICNSTTQNVSSDNQPCMTSENFKLMPLQMDVESDAQLYTSQQTEPSTILPLKDEADAELSCVVMLSADSPELIDDIKEEAPHQEQVEYSPEPIVTPLSIDEQNRPEVSSEDLQKQSSTSETISHSTMEHELAANYDNTPALLTPCSSFNPVSTSISNDPVFIETSSSEHIQSEETSDVADGCDSISP
ncbi:serine/threonine-protein phosphatase 6 regulatory subunit 3-like isoform X1 [Clavelina lepadiformis]|uniref:serine/threonine-protein phosphatase 6 regulatory subunit 3-like isoform X1 n=1 Tax=Clavelina lepadiformis TaxID=159417 RepID=UPI0040439400